jgi:hypothetical protein
VTPEGRKPAARSAGKTSRDEALLVVAEWLKYGVPSGRKRRPRPVDTAMEGAEPAARTDTENRVTHPRSVLPRYGAIRDSAISNTKLGIRGRCGAPESICGNIRRKGALRVLSFLQKDVEKRLRL